MEDSELDLESDQEPDENEGFINLWQKVKENEDIKFERLKDRYLADGESDEDATDMAEKRIQSYNERGFFQLYAQLLQKYLIPMNNSRIHRNIVKKISDMVSVGSLLANATSKVIRKKRNMDKFDNLFEIQSEESDVEDGEESVSDTDSDTE